MPNLLTATLFFFLYLYLALAQETLEIYQNDTAIQWITAPEPYRYPFNVSRDCPGSGPLLRSNNLTSTTESLVFTITFVGTRITLYGPRFPNDTTLIMTTSLDSSTTSSVRLTTFYDEPECNITYYSSAKLPFGQHVLQAATPATDPPSFHFRNAIVEVDRTFTGTGTAPSATATSNGKRNEPLSNGLATILGVIWGILALTLFGVS